MYAINVRIFLQFCKNFTKFIGKIRTFLAYARNVRIFAKFEHKTQQKCVFIQKIVKFKQINFLKYARFLRTQETCVFC